MISRRYFSARAEIPGPLIVPYKIDELVEDLNAVVPYDWAAFLHDRVDKIDPHADLAGIERGGYRLVYKEKPNPSSDARQASQRGPRRGGFDYWFSIGLRVGGDGTIGDVRWNGPADKGRLAPGVKILAVNGRVFSSDVLRRGDRAAKGSSESIHLIVQAESFVSTAEIDYHDGERYPVLERIAGSPAYLDEITKPLTTVEKPPVEAKKTSNSAG